MLDRVSHHALDGDSQQPLSIREKFDDRFRELSIDCFSIYTRDLWRGQLPVPQEIDTCLFYPELTYAGPYKAFAADASKLFDKENTRELNGIRGRFFDDATHGPASPSPDRLARATWLGPLVQSFLEREGISSSAMFAPAVPDEKQTEPPPSALQAIRARHDTHVSDLLFFNYRGPADGPKRLSVIRSDFDNWHGEGAYERQALALAREILAYIPVLVAYQHKRSSAAAIRSVRAFSGLVDTINSRHASPMSPGQTKNYYNDLASNLQQALLTREEEIAERGKLGGPELIVSIYLLEQSAAEPEKFGDKEKKNARLLLPHELGGYFLRLKGSSMSEDDRKVMSEMSEKSPSQWFMHPDKPVSITVLTTATACTHVLQRVDRSLGPGPNDKFNAVVETSLPLTVQQAHVAIHECGYPLVREDVEVRRINTKSGPEPKPDLNQPFCVLVAHKPPLPGARCTGSCCGTSPSNPRTPTSR